MLNLFSFRVNPVTYVSIAEYLLFLWDGFASRSKIFADLKYFKDHYSSIKRCRTIF